MRTVWLHVHVPKAGGSTMRQLMNRTFGDGYYNSNSLLETKQYTRQEVSEIIRCHPWLRGFSDHKLSLNLPFDSQHADVLALCFVRDPVERFISRFFFHRHFEEVNCIAQKLTFREFANMELIEKFADPQTNSQIQFLNGGLDNQSLDPIEAAIETDQTFLFPIERFDEACICLERFYPHVFADLSYVRVNISNRKEVVEPRDRDFVSEQLDFDVPVVALANRQLDHCLDRAFASLEERLSALSEFQDRCGRRYHNFRPLREKDEPRPKIAEIASDQSTNKPDHVNPDLR